METSRIKDFYQSAKVFITGGTGFVGKILIEKLLRSADVSTLYLLIREKNGEDVHRIVDKLLQNRIFDKMKKRCPDYRQKIQAVKGDCSEPGLGLGASDRQTIILNTNIIFHLAATVRFDANLKTAYRINVCGTRDLIQIAKQMRNLKSFMHTSTAYSNFPVNYIQEKLYDFPEPLEEICQVIEELDEKEVDKRTVSIIEPWPNTYTFTKALAELLIKNRAGSLPIGVFRPSVVMPTYKEPVAGWTDNLNGPSGACLAIITGLLKVLPPDINESMADLVPVDTCVSGLIASAWDITMKKNCGTTKKIPVYNYVCGANASPMKWTGLMKISAEYGRKYMDRSANKIFIVQSRVASYNWVLKLIYHIVPAFFLDIFSFFGGRHARLMAMHRKLGKSLNVLRPFYTNTWNFDNDNVTQLWRGMNGADREMFPLSLRAVNWNIYFANYIKGLRQFVKDPRAASKGITFFWEVLKTSLVFFACNTVLSNYQSILS